MRANLLTVLGWLLGLGLMLIVFVSISTNAPAPYYRAYHIDPVSGSCYVRDIKGYEKPCDYDTLERAIQNKNID